MYAGSSVDECSRVCETAVAAAVAVGTGGSAVTRTVSVCGQVSRWKDACR